MANVRPIDGWLIFVDKHPHHVYAQPYALRNRELSASLRKVGAPISPGRSVQKAANRGTPDFQA
jgi:hypothetical protein